MNGNSLDSKLVLIIVTLASSLTICYIASYNYDNFLGFYSYVFCCPKTTTFASPKVHDKHYDLRKALAAAATKENVVIITLLNAAWTEPNNIFDLFLESFRIGNNITRHLKHVLFIAVDEKAYLRCQTLVSHCYLFKSNQSGEMLDHIHYMSPLYLDFMWNRLALLKTILTLGYSFLFTDLDVMWFRDPFPHFDQHMDFQLSCDFFNGNPFDNRNYPNAEFMFVRSNNRTIQFYNAWLASRITDPSVLKKAQDVFRKIIVKTHVKKIGLRLRYLDTDYFGGLCTPSNDFNKVCTMHANCLSGLDRKIDCLTIILEDKKRYVNDSPKINQMSTFRWTVPSKYRVPNSPFHRNIST